MAEENKPEEEKSEEQQPEDEKPTNENLKQEKSYSTRIIANTGLIGKVIKQQYTILEKIGQGGMATVYSAMQHSMNRKVAIKVLPPHFMHDEGFIERFEREVEVISRLEHPHILPIYDYGESEGIPFIAMRYLGGGSMAQLVRRGVPELIDIGKPFQQVSEALDYAHQQGVIHRDLKPGNIMLDENGNAYLSDFGIARVMGSNLTGSAIIGTPAYMSPEQAHGESIDARSDIYSLGIVLFEIITGREPYQAETPLSLLLKHINEPIPPISEFRSNVPEVVQLVVNKATAKDPDIRYVSATELAEDLRKALQGVPPTVAAATRPMAPPQEKDQATVIPATPSERLTPVPKRPDTIQIRRSSMLQAMAGSAVLLTIIAAVAAYMLGVFSPQVAVPDGYTMVDEKAYTAFVPAYLASSLNSETNGSRSIYRWQDSDELSISVALADDSSLDAYFGEYYADFEADSSSRMFIDEATSLDGTVRRSYRVEGDETLPNGQIDLFFMQREGKMVIIEMFTSDAHLGNNPNILDDLQTLLSSIRIKGNA